MIGHGGLSKAFCFSGLNPLATNYISHIKNQGVFEPSDTVAHCIDSIAGDQDTGQTTSNAQTPLRFFKPDETPRKTVERLYEEMVANGVQLPKDVDQGFREIISKVHSSRSGLLLKFPEQLAALKRALKESEPAFKDIERWGITVETADLLRKLNNARHDPELQANCMTAASLRIYAGAETAKIISGLQALYYGVSAFPGLLEYVDCHLELEEILAPDSQHIHGLTPFYHSVTFFLPSTDKKFPKYGAGLASLAMASLLIPEKVVQIVDKESLAYIQRLGPTQRGFGKKLLTNNWRDENARLVDALALSLANQGQTFIEDIKKQRYGAGRAGDVLKGEETFEIESQILMNLIPHYLRYWGEMSPVTVSLLSELALFDEDNWRVDLARKILGVYQKAVREQMGQDCWDRLLEEAIPEKETRERLDTVLI